MILDACIIGGGPAGLAVANSMDKAGLNYLVVEKGPIANHIMGFPVFMRFFSSRELLEIDSFPMTIPDEKPDRRQYLTYLNHFTHSRGLRTRNYTEVVSVKRDGEGIFEIALRGPYGAMDSLRARSVVAATGAFENPRMLNVPGEDLPHVSHVYREAHPFFGKQVLVVGGRNSAIEVALQLHRAGVHVSLSYRRGDLNGSGIKYWVKPDIDKRLEKREIIPYLSTEVVRFEEGRTILRDAKGNELSVENDFVLCMTGYDPPRDFLENIGVRLAPETSIPFFQSDTLETETRGLFVAGTIIGGNVSGKVFIENSRDHGDLILKGLRDLV